MPTARLIADIFEQHVDELGFLFGRWRTGLRDPDRTLKSVGELEERIAAHLLGIEVPGEAAWPHLRELVNADDPDLAFAAGFSLLHWNRADLTDAVLDAFAAAEGELLDALGFALGHGPLHAYALERIRGMLDARSAARAAAAAEVLAFHDALELTSEQLRRFLGDEGAATRRAGWRIAALLGAQLQPQSYAAAMRDPDPAVIVAAVEAGVWAGVPAMLAALRLLLDNRDRAPRLAALRLLGVLGTPEDMPRLRDALDDRSLGPQRYGIAASAGAPALVPRLIEAMSDPDPATAAAAGAAFARLTGVDVESDQRAELPPEDGSEPDEFDAEFVDEVMLPDAAKAQREWERLRPQLEHVPRICRGVAAHHALDPAFGATLDMLSRHELCLRARFTRAWQGTLLALERFPQGGTPLPTVRSVPVAAPAQRAPASAPLPAPA